MLSALDKMVNSVRNRQEVLDEIKNRTGRRMIGYFHPVIPAELIYAAGLHPVLLSPNFEDSITVGNSHLQTYLCSYLRAEWDQIIKGRHSHLDGAIIPRSCEAVTFLYQTLKRHNPYQFVDYINVPWKRSDNMISFLPKSSEGSRKIWRNSQEVKSPKIRWPVLLGSTIEIENFCGWYTA